MRFRFVVILCALLFPAVFTLAHGGEKLPQFISPEAPVKSGISFVQNKGQWPGFVQYMADVPSGRLFVESNRLVYNFVDTRDLHDRYYHRTTERNAPLSLDCHGVFVKFINANPQVTIEPGGKLPQYNNYFIGNDPSKWAGDVPLFTELVYKNLWPGIDMELITQNGHLKYQFILHPGADPNSIRLEYEGADQLFTDAEGKLHFVTSITTVIEEPPIVVYDWADSATIPCNFKVNGKVLTYEFPQGYDRNSKVILDPTLIFSTFTGSTADNFGYTATYDNAGNYYAGGIAFGAGYPTTAGAFQTAFGGGGTGGAWNMAGGIDISITKFNPTGTAIVYSTYIGGSDNEQPHSLVTNAAGELFIYGACWSGNYPVSGLAYDVSYNGNGDIVVSRLSAGGNLLSASTYIGGTNADGLNVTTAFFMSSLKHNYGDDARGEIILDSNGNVYVASMTQSNDWPTQSAFQSVFGGAQDGVVFKMPPNLNTLNFSTYLGGTGNDACYSVKIGAGFEPFVSGGTESADFPTTAGTIQTAYGGAIDGFVTRLAPNGSSLVASTYMGTTSYDQTYFVDFDLFGDVYVYGQTLGNWTVSAGVYGTAGAPQFLMKIKPDLAGVTWSTAFGVPGTGSVNLSPTALLIDICGFIYISGWGGTVNFSGNTFGLDLTPDAYQSTTDGSDFYLMVLEQNAQSLVYGSYFGGPISAEHVDGGTSRFAPNLEIYQAVCAGCGSNSDFPTTPGVVSNTNNSTNCNEGCFKFQFDPQTVIAAYIATPFDSCAPFPVTFVNQSTGGVFWIWDYGDGSTPDTTFTPSNVGHLYSIPGSYQVTLTVVDSNSCNIADTIVQTVTVHSNPISSSTGGGNICNGAAVQLFATGGNTYTWLPAAGLNNATIPNPIATPAVTTDYMVIVTDTFGCVDTSYATVTVSNYTAEAGPPTSFCQGTGGAQLFAGTPTGGTGPYWYEWTCDTTSTWCGLDSVFDNDPIANPNGTTMYYLQVTDFYGCVSFIDSVLVTVLPLPIVDAGPDRFICSDDSAPGAFITPSISNAPGPYTFDWTPGAGLNDSTILNPYARPDTTTIYTLVVTSSNGCTSLTNTVDTTSSVTVFVQPLPVANAGPDQHICYLDSVLLPGIGTDAGPLYNFQWSPADGMNDSTLTNPTVSPGATTDYVLVVWSNGCPSIGDTVTVNVHTNPTANAGPDRDICLGDSAFLDAQAGGDATSLFFDYVWTPATGLSNDSIEDPMASPPLTTTYAVQSISSWGCLSPADSVLVTIKPTPIAEAGPPLEICAGQSVQLDGSYYYQTPDTANPSQVWFNWTPAATLSDPAIADPMATPAQTLFYYLGIQYNTCFTVDSVLVTVLPTPVAGIEADTTIFCEGDTIGVFGTGGFGGSTFTWLGSDGTVITGDSLYLSPGDTITYTLIVKEGSCADTTEVTLNPIPVPNLGMLSSLTKGCVPFEVSFLELANDALLYTWNFGDGTISNEQNPTHTYQYPGTYQVTLTGTNTGACARSLSEITIEVSDTAHAGFTTDPDWPIELPIPGSTVNFFDQSINAVNWHWNFGDGVVSNDVNPQHFYLEPGAYFVTLTVTNSDGCVSTITRGPLMIVLPDLYIPNVFTPNADNVNDVFQVRYTGSQPFLLELYDRWGGLIYSDKNPNNYWDGTMDGQPAPDGVYYYLVKVGDKEYAGNATLLR